METIESVIPAVCLLIINGAPLIGPWCFGFTHQRSLIVSSCNLFKAAFGQPSQ